MITTNRKHFTQMSEQEIQSLMNAVRNSKFVLSRHAMDRMRQKRVTENQILGMLTYGKVIEAHDNIPGDIRVLVRGKVAGNYVCAVVSLVKNEVVTTYWNEAGDHHKTIDMSQYKSTRDFVWAS
jgi:hypothetical protein